MEVLFESYTEKDVAVIRWQLKSDRAFPAGIVERCAHGFPRLITLDAESSEDEAVPLNYTAIANVLWLTCPYLNEKIHLLETEKGISFIADLIDEDGSLGAVMESAHAHFYFLRKKVYGRLLGSTTKKKVSTLFDTGIGGMRYPASIKCLHQHFSHFRVYRHNVVGRMTHNLLGGKLNCNEVICRNACEGN